MSQPIQKEALGDLLNALYRYNTYQPFVSYENVLNYPKGVDDYLNDDAVWLNAKASPLANLYRAFSALSRIPQTLEQADLDAFRADNETMINEELKRWGDVEGRFIAERLVHFGLLEGNANTGYTLATSLKQLAAMPLSDARNLVDEVRMEEHQKETQFAQEIEDLLNDAGKINFQQTVGKRTSRAGSAQR